MGHTHRCQLALKKKNQVKSPSPESRVPETGSDPPIGSDRESGRDIRSFLGLAGYYRRFIENLSRLVAPMTRLTRKKVKFDWDDRCEEAF